MVELAAAKAAAQQPIEICKRRRNARDVRPYQPFQELGGVGRERRAEVGGPVPLQGRRGLVQVLDGPQQVLPRHGQPAPYVGHGRIQGPLGAQVGGP